MVYFAADAVDGKPFTNSSIWPEQKYSQVCNTILNNSYSAIVEEIPAS